MDYILHQKKNVFIILLFAYFITDLCVCVYLFCILKCVCVCF